MELHLPGLPIDFQMSTCSSCHVDYYHNPDVRIFFAAACDHRVCEPCIARLFQRGRAYPCPACGKSVRAEEFSELPGEARQVESEVKVRRQVLEVYCKTEDDFPNEQEWNEYLMEREDIIYRLVHPSSQEEVQDTRSRIDHYREMNAEQILRAQRLRPRKQFQRIINIIEEEGTFCSHVNTDWRERQQSGSAAGHPFQARYRDLLDNPPEDPLEAKQAEAAVSPFMPQPLHGERGPADLARQQTGGGLQPGLSIRKARHFFLADLAQAAALAAAVSA